MEMEESERRCDEYMQGSGEEGRREEGRVCTRGPSANERQTGNFLYRENFTEI